jgi:hypothetical protein
LGVLDGKTPHLWPPWLQTNLQSLLQELPTRRAKWVTDDESAGFLVIVQPELQPLSALVEASSTASVVGVLVDPVGPSAAQILEHQQAVRVEFRRFCQALGRAPDAAYRIFGFKLFILPDGTRHGRLLHTVVEFTRNLESIAYDALWADSKARGCISYTVESQDRFVTLLGIYIDEVNLTFIRYRESSAP